MKIEFFIPIIPPTVTQQEHKVTVRNGKPAFYDPEELKEARKIFKAYLWPHRPEEPLKGPVRLVTKWIWPGSGEKRVRWKTTKPDTDNLVKLFKDQMTKCGYWKDDAQVASEITEKFIGTTCGIFVSAEELEE